MALTSTCRTRNTPAETDAASPGEGLRERVARLEAKGLSEAELKTLRADLDALEARLAGGNH